MAINSRPIRPRTIEDCDECPNEDDCCCGIELLSASEVTLKLCGTSDGAGTCSSHTPQSPCITITGGGQNTGTLDSGDPKFGFCMAPGTSFSIQNLTGAPANIYLTCQDDVIGPQRLTLTIPANTTFYFDTNGGCEVTGCAP